jgi:hypothetical protein
MNREGGKSKKGLQRVPSRATLIDQDTGNVYQVEYRSRNRVIFASGPDHNCQRGHRLENYQKYKGIYKYSLVQIKYWFYLFFIQKNCFAYNGASRSRIVREFLENNCKRTGYTVY